MLLWILLFVSFTVIFTAAALVWWRLQTEKHKQRLFEGLRSPSDPADVKVRATVLTMRPKVAKGLRGLFQSGPAPANPSQKAGWSKGRLILITAATTIVGVMIGTQFEFFMGPAARLIAGGIGAALPSLYRSRLRRKRLTAIEEQFPEALDFVSRSVRAGNAFSIGLELLGAEAAEPLKSEILMVTREMALGATLEEALHGLMDRIPLVEVRFFVSAVLLQRETGGNLAEVLGKLAISVRERLRLRSQVKAASGQGRLTATVLTILPIATLFMLRALSPEYMNGMIDDPLGRNLLALAAVSQILGYIAMKFIIRIEV